MELSEVKWSGIILAKRSLTLKSFYWYTLDMPLIFECPLLPLCSVSISCCHCIYKFSQLLLHLCIAECTDPSRREGIAFEAEVPIDYTESVKVCAAEGQLL